jgi:diguanylate cyclase (GGDEF)-like protein
MLQAMLARHDRSLPRKAVAAMIVALVPLHFWSVWIGDDSAVRILAVNTGAFALFSLAFSESLRLPRDAFNRIMRGIIVVVLLLYPFRMALYFWFPPEVTPGGPLLSQYMLLLFTMVGILGVAFAMTLLLAIGTDIVQRHQRDSEIDALTGIQNRRALNRQLADAASVAGYGAVLVVDLDHFKRINDDYGHDVGDKILIASARELDAKLASFGDVTRMGGEEFAVLLRRESAAAGASLALSARQAIAAVRLPDPHDQIAVTASVGLAFRESGQSLSETLRAADLAMYHAKAAGRNCAFEVERRHGLIELRAVA